MEGINAKVLRDLLLPFAKDGIIKSAEITKLRFFEDGFSGNTNSSSRREALAKILSLPSTLSANALLEAINLTVTEEQYLSAVARVNDEENC